LLNLYQQLPHSKEAKAAEPEVLATANTSRQRYQRLMAGTVRRLTPVECERLQGFPDNYTKILWRGKTETPDGPRYKALGNSMAVPVMKWIGEGIDDDNSLG
jgi:site-specific DNA-cytosine methylase